MREKPGFSMENLRRPDCAKTNAFQQNNIYIDDKEIINVAMEDC